jgi:hypothetical protein
LVSTPVEVRNEPVALTPLVNSEKVLNTPSTVRGPSARLVDDGAGDGEGLDDGAGDGVARATGLGVGVPACARAVAQTASATINAHAKELAGR